MLAGSSAPVAQRIPAIDTPFGAEQNYAVAISYSGLDIYGFHLLEALQCHDGSSEGWGDGRPLGPVSAESGLLEIHRGE